MPESTQQVQARHVRRCTVTLTAGANLHDLVIAAFNTQQAGRGDAIKPWIIGGRILTSQNGFTFGDTLALVATATVAAATAYEAPATQFLSDTWVAGTGDMVVEVYYTGIPAVP